MSEKNGFFDDRARLYDMLISQSSLCTSYNYAAGKATSKKYHDEITDLLYEEHKIELEISNELIRRGFYSTQNADGKEISKVKKEYSALLLSM